MAIPPPMPKPKMVRVKMLQAVGANVGGEVCSFVEEEAKRLVKIRAAEFVSPPAAAEALAPGAVVVAAPEAPRADRALVSPRGTSGAPKGR